MLKGWKFITWSGEWNFGCRYHFFETYFALGPLRWRKNRGLVHNRQPQREDTDSRWGFG